jgi:hypothetical protein
MLDWNYKHSLPAALSWNSPASWMQSRAIATLRWPGLLRDRARNTKPFWLQSVP